MMPPPHSTREIPLSPEESRAARPAIMEQLAMDLAEEWSELSDELPAGGIDSVA
jgi:hypothetical protein